MKKADRIARDLEQSVSTGVDNAKDWAAPRVEAAVNWAVPRLQHGLDTASPKIQEGLKSAAHNLAGSVATVTPRLQDSLAHLAPKINEAAEGATPRLHEAVDKAAPVIASARDRVVAEYLPKLSDQLGYASEAVHRTLENAPAHVDAVAQMLVDSGVVRIAQEQAHAAKGHAAAAGKNIKVAASEVSKTASAKLSAPQKPKSKHRGLLILGIIAAAAAAGVAVWKASKPVEDPWKVPTPVTPAPVAASSVNEALKDAAGKAGAATVAAADAAADASAKAADATAAAADDAADAAKDVAEDTAAAASKVATDAKTAVRNIASSLNNGSGNNGTVKPGQ